MLEGLYNLFGKGVAMNTVTININGMDYNLKGRESAEYLQKLASYVDEKVKNIMSNNAKLSTTAAATLVALNIADELYKADEKIEVLLDKNKSLEESMNEVKEKISAIENINNEANKLKEENLLLKKELENYYKEIEVLKNDEGNKEELNKLKEEFALKEEEIKTLRKQKELLKRRNKDISFESQNLKYKVLDLEKKIVDVQVNLATEKRRTNSLLK